MLLLLADLLFEPEKGIEDFGVIADRLCDSVEACKAVKVDSYSDIAIMTFSFKLIKLCNLFAYLVLTAKSNVHSDLLLRFF